MNVVLSEFRHAELLSRYYQENSDRFKPWEPAGPEDHNSVLSWQKRLRQRADEQRRGHCAHFIGLDEEQSRVFGTCSLTNIVRGPFQACYMGYSVDRASEGRGVMTEIAVQVIDYAFSDLRLHRIMANHMPSNKRSERLLARLGFSREGVAREYLCINGKWEDHVLNALINPRSGNWPGQE